jgi:hypothetical protein
VAVGHTVDAPEQAIVEGWNDKTWRMQAIPQPAKDTELSRVSCSRARACTAVGWNNASGNSRPLALSWHGKTWQVPTVPSAPAVPAGIFDAVSRTSASVCTATGTTFSHPGGPTLAESWDGKAWRVEPSGLFRERGSGRPGGRIVQLRQGMRRCRRVRPRSQDGILHRGLERRLMATQVGAVPWRFRARGIAGHIVRLRALHRSRHIHRRGWPAGDLAIGD